MKQISTYANKKMLVLGLGKSGLAVSKLLLQLGAKLTLNDQHDLSHDPAAQELSALGVRIIGGHHPVELLKQEHFDYLVKNPGIPYDNPMVKAALALKLPVITEPEIALKASEAPYVCITGSNGKTTTVMLTQQIMQRHLAQGGHHAYAVGNIGVPISEVVLKATKDDLLIVEMSSFQLLGVTDIDPVVAAIIDIYPNVHLDYHKTFANYVAAKLRVTQTQSAAHYFLANADQADILVQEKAVTPAKMLTFSEEDRQADYFIADGYLQSQTAKLMATSKMKLPGIHNQQNALVACAIAQLLGAAAKDWQAVLATFTGAKHRLQYVMTLNGREVYNDSKSTNIEAASVAIPSFQAPEVLLAGGLDRGFTFEDLIPLMQQHVKAAVFYGQTRSLLAQAAKAAGLKQIVVTETLQAAVPKAYALSAPGDVLLFSPACASWDQFKSFEERGDYFIKLIKELKTE